MSFVHLHVHSSYSLLEGADGVEALLRAAAHMGYGAMALTDTDGLYGTLEFLRLAEQYGVRPIVGVELTEPGRGRSVVALARDQRGYSQLCRLVTRRHLEEGFDLKEALGEHSGYLVVMCREPALLRQLRDVLPEGDLYAELVGPLPPTQRWRLRALADEARRLQVPLVATADVHFVSPKGHRIHRVLSAIRTRRTIHTLPPGAAVPPTRRLHPPSAMERSFAQWPDALGNTCRIAESCELALELGRQRFPRVKLPRGETPFSLLAEAAFSGLRRRMRPLSPQALQRLTHELRVIEELDLAPYFLVVWEIVRFARSRGIPTIGRGSAANSLVCYALGITHVDPLRHGLYFERFLNPQRRDCPDIDLDLPWNRRDEIIRHVYETYGHDHVAMISTHVTFRGRSILREVARALGIPLEEVHGYIRRIPHFARISELEEIRSSIPEARGLPLEEEPLRGLVAVGRHIEGFVRHISVHCGGIVICPCPITEIVPLQRVAKGFVVTQYDMYPVEDLGLVKIDLLGQRSLAVIQDTIEAVRKRRAVEVDFESLDPTRDPATRRIMREGRTMGCFYVESPGMRNLLKKLKVEDFELLVAASSIIRPGVSNSGMMRAFVERHNGLQPVTYLHPLMEELLKETYGIMIYQEDVIKVAHMLAGMTLGEADALRKCMSKKRNWQAMETHRERFIQGAVANGVPPEAAEEIWRQVEAFGGYAFCKAHSASFALISYQAAYLKAHYPAEFMAAVISNQGGFYHTAAYVEEARRMGLKVLLPDVNSSHIPYTAETLVTSQGGTQEAIRIGLMQVKGLSRRTMEAIVEQRCNGGPYRSLWDLREKTRAGHEELRALILCGALDSLGRSRPELLLELEHLRRAAEGGGRGDGRLPFPPGGGRKGLRDYTPQQKARLEMEALGLMVSLPPVIRPPGVVAARDLGLHVGRRVRVVGRWVTSKRTRTRSGQWMRFLTLEDDTDTFEVTLFPRVYRRYGHLLVEEGPWLVTGTVEDDCGAVTLVAERIQPLKAPREDNETWGWSGLEGLPIVS